METFSLIAIILLSLVAYSAGVVGKAGRFVQPKPQIIDLILVSVIWSGAVYSRTAFDLNKWLAILVWVILSVLIGVLATWLRKLSEEKASSDKGPEEIPGTHLKKLWQRWGNFSTRMGNFQSRIVLSLFFFILVSPFALTVKIFSDPLKIRYRSSGSFWLPKMKTEVNLEQFRRQS